MEGQLSVMTGRHNHGVFNIRQQQYQQQQQDSISGASSNSKGRRGN
jgi:hypothetical protein